MASWKPPQKAVSWFPRDGGAPGKSWGLCGESGEFLGHALCNHCWPWQP